MKPPKIRRAEINPLHRVELDQMGQLGIQLTFAEIFGRVQGVQGFVERQAMARSAQAWLNEYADKEARREWRNEILEVVIVIFVGIEIILSLVQIYLSVIEISLMRHANALQTLGGR